MKKPKRVEKTPVAKKANTHRGSKKRPATLSKKQTAVVTKSRSSSVKPKRKSATAGVKGIDLTLFCSAEDHAEEDNEDVDVDSSSPSPKCGRTTSTSMPLALTTRKCHYKQSWHQQ